MILVFSMQNELLKFQGPSKSVEYVQFSQKGVQILISLINRFSNCGALITITLPLLFDKGQNIIYQHFHSLIRICDKLSTIYSFTK